MRVPNIDPDRITPPVQEFEDRRSINQSEFIDIILKGYNMDSDEIEKLWNSLKEDETEEYRELWQTEKRAYKELKQRHEKEMR